MEKAASAYEVPGYFTRDDIRKLFLDDGLRRYSSLTNSRRTRLAEVERVLELDKLLSRAKRYAQGNLAAQLTQVWDEIHTTFQASVSEAERVDQQNIQRIISKYAAFLTQAEETVKEMYTQAAQRREADYNAACQTMEQAWDEKSFSSAAKEFERLGDYKDASARAEQCKNRMAQARTRRLTKRNKKIGIFAGSATAVILAGVILITQVIVPGVQYWKAETLLAAEDYKGASAVFAELGDYKDASERAEQTSYIFAKELLESGDTVGAAIAFGKMENYSDAREQSFALWNEIVEHNTFEAGFKHTVGLKSDGTVVASGLNDEGQCNVENWTDIVAVACGDYHTVGLKSDGTVVVAGDSDDGQCNTEGWTDVIAADCGWYHTVGLKSEGAVVATGWDDLGRLDVEDWTDIIAVDCGPNYTIGLKSDGTVVATGLNDEGQCDVESWTNIKVPN